MRKDSSSLLTVTHFRQDICLRTAGSRVLRILRVYEASCFYLLSVMLYYANSIPDIELSQQKSFLLMPCYALYIPVFLKN